MKRISLGTLAFLFAILSSITYVSSCDVDHTYEAEILVVDALGDAMSGVTVTTDVNVNAEHVVWKSGTTDSNGLVSFAWNNLAILKVNADKGNYHGEALLILEEDKEVKVTVVVYN